MKSCQQAADGALEASDGRGSGHLERMESPRAYARKLLYGVRLLSLAESPHLR